MKKINLIVSLILLSAFTFAQSKHTIPLIGEEAPYFKAESTNGFIRFPKDFGTSWKLILSHPMDFTPVCSTEILALAGMQEDFDELNVDIILVSTDPLNDHYSWKEWIDQILEENHETVRINFPLVDDENRQISSKYGMLHEHSGTTKDVRGVFIIDPDNIIRFTMFYPVEVGRNLEEIKRAVVALQTTYKTDVYTPANWEPGDDVLLYHYNQEDLSDPNVYQLAWFLTFKKYTP
jgi:peroxiredoxin (alkyl hydroperoxide reductase subunit C)